MKQKIKHKSKSKGELIIHPIPPVFNETSEILILGSFPSVASRNEGFFYGHKQNRFWTVLARSFEENVPKTTDEKKEFLLKHKIALWDVIASCKIRGSSDSSITDIVPNDLTIIANIARIRKILTNGKLAHKLYCKTSFTTYGIEAICLPSTSPANAALNIDKLVSEWKPALIE